MQKESSTMKRVKAMIIDTCIGPVGIGLRYTVFRPTFTPKHFHNDSHFVSSTMQMKTRRHLDPYDIVVKHLIPQAIIIYFNKKT